jgi:hypothetical protein
MKKMEIINTSKLVIFMISGTYFFVHSALMLDLIISCNNMAKTNIAMSCKSPKEIISQGISVGN